MAVFSLGHLNPFRSNTNLKPLYKTDQYNGEELQGLKDNNTVFRGTEEDKEAYEIFLKRFHEYKIDVNFKRCPECQVASFSIYHWEEKCFLGLLGERWGLQLYDLCPV